MGTGISRGQSGRPHRRRSCSPRGLGSAYVDRLPQGSSIRKVELGFLPAGTIEMLALVKKGAIAAPELERRVIAQYRLFCVDHVEEYRRTFAIAQDASSYP